MFKLSKLSIVVLLGILLIGLYSISFSQQHSVSKDTSKEIQDSTQTQMNSTHENNTSKDNASKDNASKDNTSKDNTHQHSAHQHKSTEQIPAEDVDIRFTLASSFFEGKRIFVGDSSNINGQINPVLELNKGAVVEITLLNYTIWSHNFVIPDLAFHSEHVGPHDAITFTFQADLESGSSYPYYCTVDNHNQHGMEGLITIKKE